MFRFASFNLSRLHNKTAYRNLPEGKLVLAEYFTNLEPKILLICEFYVAQKRRSADFVSLELKNFHSGNWCSWRVYKQMPKYHFDVAR